MRFAPAIRASARSVEMPGAEAGCGPIDAAVMLSADDGRTGPSRSLVSIAGSDSLTARPIQSNAGLPERFSKRKTAYFGGGAGDVVLFRQPGRKRRSSERTGGHG